ncbi:lycopene cyclase [Flavobacteriaceae bacterium R38]|nr:lycopene cyclase [Flavobacteriaceae bacterium R38]
MKHYDYIILGAGASGLQLAYYMAMDDFYNEKSILIIDKSKKNKNDRTWCFWETGQGDFDNIVYKTWDTAFIGSSYYNRALHMQPYVYKMIRGIDFYNYILGILNTRKNITLVQEEILSYNDNGNIVTVNTASKTYEADRAFNSLFNMESILTQKKFPVLQQHFIGWYVKTETAVFNPERVTFMDFSVPQKGNTRFMYVLPISPTEALIEYTLFSEHLLPNKEYEEAIEAYLKRIGIGTGTFKILEKERGSIPMTCYDFQKADSKNLIHIGTAGGWTKASTGFTFKNTNEKIKKLIQRIKKEEDFSKLGKKNRFWYYDLLLLDVLYKRNDLGAYIFPSLFKRNRTQMIFKFLEEKTTPSQEIKILFSVTHWEFIKAFLRRIFKQSVS